MHFFLPHPQPFPILIHTFAICILLLSLSPPRHRCLSCVLHSPPCKGTLVCRFPVMIINMILRLFQQILVVHSPKRWSFLSTWEARWIREERWLHRETTCNWREINYHQYPVHSEQRWCQQPTISKRDLTWSRSLVDGWDERQSFSVQHRQRRWLDLWTRPSVDLSVGLDPGPTVCRGTCGLTGTCAFPPNIQLVICRSDLYQPKLEN